MLQNVSFLRKTLHMPSALAFSSGRFYVAKGGAISDVKLLVQEFNFTFNFKKRAQASLLEKHLIKR